MVIMWQLQECTLNCKREDSSQKGDQHFLGT